MHKWKNRNPNKKIPSFNIGLFLSKIDFGDPLDCWNWNGGIRSKCSPYGRFSINRKSYVAHRVSFDLFIGIKSTDNVIDHLCRNIKCCNPRHLREVDMRTNTLENSIGPAAVNAEKKKCIRGHFLSGLNLRIYTFNGAKHRACRKCSNMHSINHRRRKKGLLNVG